jgi:hypothetical protein
MPKCTAFNKGTTVKCGRFAMKNTLLCYSHTPHAKLAAKKQKTQPTTKVPVAAKKTTKKRPPPEPVFAKPPPPKKARKPPPPPEPVFAKPLPPKKARKPPIAAVLPPDVVARRAHSDPKECNLIDLNPADREYARAHNLRLITGKLEKGEMRKIKAGSVITTPSGPLKIGSKIGFGSQGSVYVLEDTNTVIKFYYTDPVYKVGDDISLKALEKKSTPLAKWKKEVDLQQEILKRGISCNEISCVIPNTEGIYFDCKNYVFIPYLIFERMRGDVHGLIIDIFVERKKDIKTAFVLWLDFVIKVCPLFNTFDSHMLYHSDWKMDNIFYNLNPAKNELIYKVGDIGLGSCIFPAQKIAECRAGGGFTPPEWKDKIDSRVTVERELKAANYYQFGKMLEYVPQEIKERLPFYNTPKMRELMALIKTICVHDAGERNITREVITEIQNLASNVLSVYLAQEKYIFNPKQILSSLK